MPNTPHTINALGYIHQRMAELGAPAFVFCKENNHYVASVCGNIFSVCRWRDGERVYDVRRLGGAIDSNGYRTYQIKVEGVDTKLKGHRLVYGAFFGLNGSMPITHKDGHKRNNELDNLAYAAVAA